MWAAIIRGGCVAAATLVFASATLADGAVTPTSSGPVLTERPLFLVEQPQAHPGAPRHIGEDGTVRTAPVPPAALTGVVLVGGIIVAGISRRRSK